MAHSADQDLLRADFVAANASAATDFSMAGLVLKSAADSGSRALTRRHYKAVASVLERVDYIRQMRDAGTTWMLLDEDQSDGSTSTQMIAAAAIQREGSTGGDPWDRALDRLIEERDAVRLVGQVLEVTQEDSARRFAGWLNEVARHLVQSATRADLNRTSESSIA